MKKTIVKILAISILMAGSVCVNAQTPPKPSKKPSSQAQQSIHRVEKGPVGTATLLMLGLGGAALGYKLKKNKEQED
ncbi:MAG: hypothetical protein J6M30_03140 [Bacteroidales bacterium]|nr:hypothetical protein [Bacteroidales bacterium]